VRHATEDNLRRLQDEPLAVPDRVTEHIGGCRRCRARLADVRSDAQRSAQLLAGPQPVPDVDAAWWRLQRASAAGDEQALGNRDTVVLPRRSFPFLRVSMRSGLVAGGVALLAAGTATAATLTNVFSPTHMKPVTIGASDLSELADFMGIHQNAVLGGFPASSGSLTFRFGTISWSSAGAPQQMSTLAAADRAAGFSLVLPSHLPSGVAGPKQFAVQPRVTVKVMFNKGLATVGGSSVVLQAGPAVLAEYGSSAGAPEGGDVPTLGIMTMPRPTAVASGASLRQIEAFLLDQPGVPSDLKEEVRLLGDLGTTLPVPVPAGAVVRSVEVDGSPGVLVADPSGLVSGLVWEDGSGMVRAVAGLVDQHDVVNVADQLR
jgi:hypothetical protein